MNVGTITPELKDMIIEQNDLREVAADYGVIFNSIGKACCPFHNDGKNGNLHIFERTGENPSYFCFAETCGAGRIWADKAKTKRHMLTVDDHSFEDGGPSVIGFVMNIEQCSYIEACVKLMERAGIPIPEGKENLKHKRHKSKMTKLNVYYCKQLLKRPKILDYLNRRGITLESIKKWRLGFIPSNDTSAPLGSKVSGRLVFGLEEESYGTPKTIAMAYRTLRKETPKYYNDYTVEGLYEKKHYLYGFSKARKHIRSMGYAILMEGYTDVIIAHQAGLVNSIATCGTALTEYHLDKLSKVTKNLLLWFDGDSAGWSAMLSKIPLLIEYGFRVQVAVAKGKDPAEWINSMNQDAKKVKEFVAKIAKPALQVLMHSALSNYRELKEQAPPDSVLLTERVHVLDEILPIINSLKDESVRIVYRSYLESKLNIRI